MVRVQFQPAESRSKLIITHTWDSDLYLYLVAPNGQILELSSANGSSGDDFTNTIFSDAGATNITAGTAPFTGTFKPEGSLTAGCSLTPTVGSFGAIGGGSVVPDGNWTLRVFDNAGGDVGTLTNWTLNLPASSGGTASNAYTDFNNIITSMPALPTIVTSQDFVCPGTYNFASSSNGLPGYTYLWSVTNPSGGSSTITTPTAGSTNITFTNTTGGNLVYTVILTVGTECCGNLGTITKTITVYPAPTITTQPVNVTVCEGGNATFTGAAIGQNLTYQWQESTNNGVTWTDIVSGGIYSGVNSSSLVINGVTIGMNGYQYRLVVNSLCGSATTNAAILYIKPLPTAVVSSPDAHICLGQSASIVINFTGTAPWTITYIENNGTTSTTHTITTSSNPYTITVSPTTTTSYTITNVSDGNSCSNTATGGISVIVDQVAPVIVITNPDPVCAPNTVNISLPYITAGSTTDGPLQYWTSYPTPATPLSNPLTVGSGTYYISNTNACGTAYGAVVVTVNPVLTPTFGSFGPYCIGDIPSVLPTTSNNGVTGTWSPSTIITSSEGSVVYTFTPAAGSCAVSTTMSVVTSNCCPTIVCPENINISVCNQPLPIGATDTATFNALDATSSTNAATISFSDATSTVGCIETTSRTYTATNSNGTCAVTCQQIITRHLDAVNPTASNPTPISVQCPSLVPASNIAVVTDEADNCGVPTVTFLGDVSNGLVCPEIITRTYKVVDACNNSINVTQTITIAAPTVTMPANGSSTVSCASLAVAPTALAPVVTDNCGRTLTAVLVGSTATPSSITCNGTVVWTYRYTACDGTTADWTHTYTVTMSGGLTPPANTTATVACPANATDPGAPANITDACGRTLTPVLIGSVSTPSSITCNGTVVWTYRYTACDGTTADWTHTYTVTMAGGLTPPANTTATLACPANATDPGAPANITDACGRTLTPVLIGSVSTPSSITCNGTVVWTYRYTACDGTTADWTHTYTVTMAGGLTPPANTTATVACPANATDPGAPANITDACGRTLTPVLVGSVSTPSSITCNGTVVWTYRYTACDGTIADWTHTYTVTMAGGLTPPANTTATVACPANATDPGAPANITDACGRTLTPVLVGSVSTPSSITCNGTVVWTYRYTACDGTTADWTHTYTVTMAGGLTPPANTTATVTCPANATDPGAPANITDACGRSLTPVLIGSVSTPSSITCNGTVVWTYRYTACDGTTADWTHTYTVTMSGVLTPPANTTATVACPANATDPGAPANITDACGRTLTPVLIGSVSTPSSITCNGTVVWTYRYTTCDGTTADWTHTYTVTMAGGLTPPANTTATVACPANATDPGAPANITDACGRTLTPVLVGSVSTPSSITCNGTVVWTYRYTACDGTTADWTHTYTVMAGGLTPPANTDGGWVNTSGQHDGNGSLSGQCHRSGCSGQYHRCLWKDFDSSSRGFRLHPKFDHVQRYGGLDVQIYCL